MKKGCYIRLIEIVPQGALRSGGVYSKGQRAGQKVHRGDAAREAELTGHEAAARQQPT